MKARFIVLAIVIHAGASLCTAQLLSNGNFETGDLSGWTVFLTPNGDLGSQLGLPNVTMFDVDGDGTASLAARFEAGELAFDSSTGHTSQGGGLFQTFSAPAGQYTFSAKIAALNLDSSFNDTAGVFSLFVDGTLRNSVDFKQLFGVISHGETQRSSLFATVPLNAGTHEVRFQITRNWLNGGTPYEYLDNVQVEAIPEPMPSALVALAAVGLGFWRFLRARESRPVCSNASDSN